MTALAGSFARHSRAIALAVVLLTLGGIIAATRMPVSLFPLLSYPRVVVSIDAGTRDAGQMAAEITRPIEIALRTVPGVTHLRSTTSRGSAEVALNFAWGDDMVAAALSTEAALSATLPDLPPGTRFEVRRMDPTIFPVLGMALTSDSLDQAALRQIAELKIRPALTSVPGVAGVDILGGAPREISVDVDPARLAALGLSVTAIRDALANTNIIEGTGRIEDRHRLYLVLADERVSSSAALAEIPIKSTGGGVVTLGQVAAIHPATAPDFTRVTANSHAAVLINVRQALAGDTVAIVQAVDARLKSAGIPPSVRVSPYYDQSELVTGATEAVRDAILFGAVLAGLVLFVFLRSWRLMLITALTLPAVLAGTALLLYAFGLSFNIMTLGGMAAAVGLIIDDAVVMLEHVMRRMEEGTAPDVTSRLAAAAEMNRPLLGSTFATMIVFLPLAFVTGVTGGFFKALAVTMVASLALSLLYARVVIPLIAANWLRDEDVAAARRAERLTDRAVHAYDRGAARVLARPGPAVSLVAIGGALLGWLAWNHVPSGFMPAMDEGGFVLDYKAQPGAALTDTSR
ncbi:MAG: efflux RND transporter permease subunit, partial [Novosphingobium sp.]